MAEENLKQKTVSGVQWNTIDKIATLVITIVVSIVLARVLGPESYGIIGVASIFINVFYTFIDSGFSSALIRKETIAEEDYSTAFMFNLIVSCFLYVSLVVSSPAIARFFNQPILTQLLPVMGLIVIINAICLTQVTKLSRDIDFKTQAKVSIISIVASGVVGVSMAFWGCGVWSLAGQQITLYGMRCYLLCLFNRWFPKFKFSKDSFSYLFGFGWKVLLSNIISSIWVQGNKIIIGKMYPAEILGYYTKSQDWPNQFANNLGSVVRSVGYPALSRIQNEPERMLANFRRILRMTFFVSIVLCFGISSVSHSLVLTLYGEEWSPAIKFVQVISLAFVTHAPILFVLSILQVKNRTDIFLYLEIAGKLVSLIPFGLGIMYGVMWLVWGSVGLSIVQFILDLIFSGKQIGYTFNMAMKDLTPSFLVGGVMYVCVWPLCMTAMPPLVMLIVQMAVGGSVVIVISKLFHLEEYKETMNMVMPMKNKILGVIKR